MNTQETTLEKATVLCLKNAKQYIKDAEILHSFKSYKHSLALTVLSDVELGKAVIYHLWSKDLIEGRILPEPFQVSFLERQYRKFASETWWVGLTIASNVEFLVQEILDASEQTPNAAKGEKFSALTMKKITGVIEKMQLENDKLIELESYRSLGFFADSMGDDNNINSISVEKSLARVRIQQVKNRLRVGTPFLSLSFSEASNGIVKALLKEAFRNVVPLRDKITQFVFSTKD